LLAAVVGGIIANVQLGYPSPPEASQSSIAEFIARQVELPTVADVDPVVVLVTLAAAAAWFLLIRRRTNASVEGGIRTFLIVPGSVVAFSSGGSQVGLATGPLENLYGAELGLPSIVLLALGATGIRGCVDGAPKLLQATSREYAQLGVRRSIAALVPGFIIAQLAIALKFRSRSTTSSSPASSAGARWRLSGRVSSEDRRYPRILAHHARCLYRDRIRLYKVFAAVLGG